MIGDSSTSRISAWWSVPYLAATLSPFLTRRCTVSVGTEIVDVGEQGFEFVGSDAREQASNTVFDPLKGQSLSLGFECFEERQLPISVAGGIGGSGF